MTQMEMGQTAGALSRAAVLVADAKADFDGLAARLDVQLESSRGLWLGAGSDAFFALQDAWQARQRQIVGALDGLAASLRTTEADNAATDELQSAHFARYAARLG